MHESHPVPQEPGPEDLSSSDPLLRDGRNLRPDDEDAAAGPLPLPRVFSRRHTPWLLVEVDGTPAAHGALVWALREAARREATVLAVAVLPDDEPHPLGTARLPSRHEQTAALQRMEAQVLRAIAETGVHGRSRTAVLERPVFDALKAAASGADLVIVGTTGKTLLRPAVPRAPYRRLPRGA